MVHLLQEILVTSVKAFVQWPNTKTLASRLANEFKNPGLEQQIMEYVESCVEPGSVYFLDKFCNLINFTKLLVYLIPPKSQISIRMYP